MANNLLLRGGIALAVLAIVMGVTNPNSESYADYASDLIMAKAEKNICESFGYCQKEKIPKFIINQVKSTIIEPALAKETQSQNLIFLSLYQTQIKGVGTIKTIGAFGHFLTYSKTKN